MKLTYSSSTVYHIIFPLRLFVKHKCTQNTDRFCGALCVKLPVELCGGIRVLAFGGAEKICVEAVEDTLTLQIIIERV